MSSSEKKKPVVPGEFLCYSEEYSPSANAFEDAEGKVFASAVGCENKSDERRSVIVESRRAKRLLKAGDLVYARVDDLYDTVALTRFRPAAQGVAPPGDSAFLRISEIRRGYVESFRGNIGIGDLLVARVKEITPLGIYLTVIENDLGVTRAFCSNCRKEMLLTTRGFYCKACGEGEERKTPAPGGAQPALYAEVAADARGPPRDRGGPRGGSRGDRGPPRGGYRGGDRGPPRRGNRGDRGGRDRGGPRGGYRGGGDRGGDRGAPRVDGGEHGGDRGGGGRERGSRGGRDRRAQRRPNARGGNKGFGSFYPAG